MEVDERTPLTGRPDFPTGIDNTMRVSFSGCPRKFEIEHLHHIRPNFPSIHLIAGGAMAKGLEIFRLGVYKDGLPEEQAFFRAVVGIIREWGDNDIFEEHNKSLWNVILAVEHYISEWSPATDTLRPAKLNGEWGIECSFALPIPDVFHPQTGEPLLYTGRYDMLAQVGDALYVEDDKTTGSLGPSWVKQWSLNSQFTGYCWAAKQHGIPVAGAIIRGIAFLKSRFDTAQCLVYRSDWEIERWLLQLQRDARRMIAAWEDGYFDYALGTACGNFGGCSFMRLCEQKHPEKWVFPDYKIEKWDPLANVKGE